MFAPTLRLDASPAVRTLVDESSQTGLIARIRIARGQIYLCVLNRRILRLVPVTPETCAIAGWSFGLMLHFDRVADKVQGLKLELRLPSGAGSKPASSFIPLPILEL
jgi:hypothetical protein